MISCSYVTVSDTKMLNQTQARHLFKIFEIGKTAKKRRLRNFLGWHHCWWWPWNLYDWVAWEWRYPKLDLSKLNVEKFKPKKSQIMIISRNFNINFICACRTWLVTWLDTFPFSFLRWNFCNKLSTLRIFTR